MVHFVSTSDMRRQESLLAKIRERAFAPVDIASLVFFRITFGLVMIGEVVAFRNLIRGAWIQPRFLFKYYGFSWVEPWPGYGLYIHWVLLGLFAALVTAGFLYRISATLLFLSWSYFFLLDEGRYINHTYLMCLFAFLLVFVPAHRAFSIDAWLRPKLRAQTTPVWTIWLCGSKWVSSIFLLGLQNCSGLVAWRTHAHVAQARNSFAADR